MAQLPGANVIPLQAAQPASDSERVGTYTPGIVQGAEVQAQQSNAQTFARIGNAADQIIDAQQRMAAASAEQDFMGRKLALDQQFARDTDYATAPQRYQQALTGALTESASGLFGTTAQSDYKNRMARWVENGTNEMVAKSTQRWKDDVRANTFDAYHSGLSGAVKAGDSPEAAAILYATRDRINAGVQAGAVSKFEGQNLHRNLEKDYALERGKAMLAADPVSAEAALAPASVSPDGTPAFPKTNDWRDGFDAQQRTTLWREAGMRAIPFKARTEVLKYVGGDSAPQAPRNGFQFASEQVGAAIRNTEWSGPGQSPTSVNGAVGNAQILPSTFQQYAKPGEDINNPQDNARVGQRIVDDLYQKYRGDPQRVAVGYFSGPGNVAPESSPVPWVRDLQDGNGQSTSGYVAKVTGRLGAISKAGVKMDEATALAMIDRDYADRPALGQAVAREAKAKYAAVNMAIAADAKMQSDQIAATNDGYVKRMLDPATTVGQLNAMSGALATDPAYEGNDKARWAMYEHLRQRVDDVTQGKMASDGQGFWQAYKRMFLPPGDPNRLGDPAQVYSLAGDGDNGVSLTGAKKLADVMKEMQKPEGAAEQKALEIFLSSSRSELTHADAFLHLKDPKGEELFQRFTTQALQAYSEGRQKGLPSWQLLSPDSPNYIGKAIGQFRRLPSVWMNDRISDMTGMAAGPIDDATPKESAGPDLATQAGLAAAVQARRIAPKDAEALARKNGWIKTPAKSAEPVTVPLAQ